ncbi:hypothetical protein TK50_13820 [Micromonospora haikouensis]|uniref:Uncharacterized protein n=1 Tax=Micromonospora haikouensis TaxID=686309 RepID=A0A0D0V5U6_9ACTN|nr:hypothetical protein TK50_13820 [Micromonospora haikouensis]
MWRRPPTRPTGRSATTPRSPARRIAPALPRSPARSSSPAPPRWRTSRRTRTTPTSAPGSSHRDRTTSW